jgi:hypothetical protein
MIVRIALCIAVFFATAAQAQQRRISCEEERDRALTQVNVVSASRTRAERALAAELVTASGLKGRLLRLSAKIENLERQAKEAKEAREEPTPDPPEKTEVEPNVDAETETGP